MQSPRTAADPRLTLAQLVTEPLRSGGRRHRPPDPDITAALSSRCAQVGLNVSTQAALLTVIADEQRHRGRGVLLITHDRTLATHWCDRLINLTTAA